MNRKQMCRILFLFALCSMLINGMLAQSIADIARQDREKQKAREKGQQEEVQDQQEQTPQEQGSAQSVADVARREKEKRKEREKNQQEQVRDQQEQESAQEQEAVQRVAEFARQEREKNPQEQGSAQSVKTYRYENVTPEAGLNAPMPLSSPSPHAPLLAPSDASPNALPVRSAGSSSAFLPLIVLGDVLLVVGGLWMLGVAFRTSILWGLGCLFLPFVSLIYSFSHWKEAKGPFVTQVVGLLVVCIAVALRMTAS